MKKDTLHLYEGHTYKRMKDGRLKHLKMALYEMPKAKKAAPKKTKVSTKPKKRGRPKKSMMDY